MLQRFWFLSGAISFPQERKAPQSNGVSLRPLKKGAKIRPEHQDSKIPKLKTDKGEKDNGNQMDYSQVNRHKFGKYFL